MDLSQLTDDEQRAYLAGELSISCAQSNSIEVERVLDGIESGIRAEIQIRTCQDFPGRVVAYVVGFDPVTGRTEDGGLLYEITETDGIHKTGVFFDASDVGTLTKRLLKAFGDRLPIVDRLDLPSVSTSTGGLVEFTLPVIRPAQLQ